MCKYFQEGLNCPLAQFCQFAHGPTELRHQNDPLPENFEKTAFGAIHSNYKTQPCKNFEKNGQCKFGDGCSFYHKDGEQRKLIDPLPSLPFGSTLPVRHRQDFNKNFQKKQKNRNHENNGGFQDQAFYKTNLQ